MENKCLTYSLGFDEELLRNEGEVLIYEIKEVDGNGIELLCDMSKKELAISSQMKDQRGEEVFDMVMNDIIDLSKNGERWEGPSLNGLPFGYGRIFDGNNVLKYCGYMFEGKKICFGEEYYEDGETVEYKGNFMNDRRHGKGILCDRKGLTVFEGNWSVGNNSPKLIISSNCNDSRLFSVDVKELIIGDCCYCDVTRLQLKHNPILERLVIGNNSFKKVNELIIVDCAKLKTLIVGDGSFIASEFTKDGTFSVANCANLSSIEIGGMSFPSFEGFELKSTACVVLLVDLPCLETLSIGVGDYFENGCFGQLQSFHLTSSDYLFFTYLIFLN